MIKLFVVYMRHTLDSNTNRLQAKELKKMYCEINQQKRTGVATLLSDTIRLKTKVGSKTKTDNSQG